MPELITPGSFSLLVLRQWIIAHALAADSHAQDSTRQEEFCWFVDSQTVISQGGEPQGGPEKTQTNIMLIKRRISKIQQQLKGIYGSQMK